MKALHENKKNTQVNGLVGCRTSSILNDRGYNVVTEENNFAFANKTRGRSPAKHENCDEYEFDLNQIISQILQGGRKLTAQNLHFAQLIFLPVTILSFSSSLMQYAKTNITLAFTIRYFDL